MARTGVDVQAADMSHCESHSQADGEWQPNPDACQTHGRHKCGLSIGSRHGVVDRTTCTGQLPSHLHCYDNRAKEGGGTASELLLQLPLSEAMLSTV